MQIGKKDVKQRGGDVGATNVHRCMRYVSDVI